MTLSDFYLKLTKKSKSAMLQQFHIEMSLGRMGEEGSDLCGVKSNQLY